MSVLSASLRRQLESAVKEARTVATRGARKALEALAVHEPDPYRHMDEAQRTLRRKLRAQAKQLGDGESQSRRGAYEIKHLVEKLAYDQWHRLLFARFLLENNLLISPEHGVSVSLDDCEELAPSLGFKDAWAVAASFAAKELPEIFRTDDPAGAVDLPVEDRNPLIQLVTGLPVEVFTASDSLGWCYQFWQAERKDEVNAAGNKIGADELPAVTQLFTEDYMVTSCSITRSARGMRARLSPRSRHWLPLRRVRRNFAMPWRCRDAPGSICASSKVRTKSGLRPAVRSRAGRRRRRNSGASTRAWAAGTSWWRCSSAWSR
jgi:hypothetical protein